MNDRTVADPPTVSIAAVERDTRLSKDTLRVWERRYGFPKPRRDANGERVYPLEQFDKLRLVRRLMDQGFRPGKIIGRSMPELQLLAAGAARPRVADASDLSDEMDRCVDFLAAHRLDELRCSLSQALLRLGLARFVIDVLAPLTTRVGEAWARGRLQVFEEHLYTDVVKSVLRGAIAAVPGARRAPRVLLTTFPQEPHGLGVLMAEAMFVLEGACCVPLGVQTPLPEIIAAASAQKVDIVGLSFTSIVAPNQVVGGLNELRTRLPDAIEIWAGGSSPALRRRTTQDVRVLDSLAEVGPAVAHWRTRRSS